MFCQGCHNNLTMVSYRIFLNEPDLQPYGAAIIYVKVHPFILENLQNSKMLNRTLVIEF